MIIYRAKRIDAGWYTYRGYRIQDHGSGRSVHAAMMRSSGRWIIHRITGPGAFDLEPFCSTWSFKEAKRRVDVDIKRRLSAP